jgi:hypothetical protein
MVQVAYRDSLSNSARPNRPAARMSTAPFVLPAGDAVELSAPLPLRPIALSDVAPKRRHHRLASSLAGLAVLAVTFLGASALVSARPVPTGTLSGAERVVGGYSYVVQRGDTLWSIVSRLLPSADPRPIVDQLSAKLGSNIVPGERIVVPLH